MRINIQRALHDRVQANAEAEVEVVTTQLERVSQLDINSNGQLPELAS